MSDMSERGEVSEETEPNEQHERTYDDGGARQPADS